MLNNLKLDNWINLYIYWELSLIKQLGFEINLLTANNPIKINNKLFTIPDLLLKNDIDKNSNNEIRDALIFNKNLLMENLITPNRLKFPLFRNILESYYI